MWTDKKIKLFSVIISVMAIIACGDNIYTIIPEAKNKTIDCRCSTTL